MFKNICLYFTLVTFVLSSSGCATYMTHPNFKERHKTIQNIGVIPPQVEIYRVAFRGDKDLMMDLMADVALQATDDLEEAFKEKDYEVQKLDTSEEALNNDPDLRTSLFNVRKLFDNAINDIRMRKQKKFTYTLGADVNELADMTDSDVLIFSRFDGYKKTGGEITKDVVKSIFIAAATLGSMMVFYYMAVGVMHVAVVDGDNGDILWFNHNEANANVDIAVRKQLKNLVRGLTRGFPKRICYEEREVAKEEEPQPAEPTAQEETEELDEAATAEQVVPPEEAPQAEAVEQAPVAEAAPQICVKLNSDAGNAGYTDSIRQEVEGYLIEQNNINETGEVWMCFTLQPSGNISDLKVVDEKTTGSSEMKGQCLLAINSLYPFSPFPEDMPKEPVTVELGVISQSQPAP